MLVHELVADVLESRHGRDQLALMVLAAGVEKQRFAVRPVGPEYVVVALDELVVADEFLSRGRVGEVDVLRHGRAAVGHQFRHRSADLHVLVVAHRIGLVVEAGAQVTQLQRGFLLAEAVPEIAFVLAPQLARQHGPLIVRTARRVAEIPGAVTPHRGDQIRFDRASVLVEDLVERFLVDDVREPPHFDPQRRCLGGVVACNDLGEFMRVEVVDLELLLQFLGLVASAQIFLEPPHAVFGEAVPAIEVVDLESVDAAFDAARDPGLENFAPVRVPQAAVIDAERRGVRVRRVDRRAVGFLGEQVDRVLDRFRSRVRPRPTARCRR